MEYASFAAILVSNRTGVASICIGLVLFMMLKEEKSKSIHIKSATREKSHSLD
jgi:hypothetical protein